VVVVVEVLERVVEEEGMGDEFNSNAGTYA